MQASDQAPGTLYIVSAPSGAGKTSLVKALLDSTEAIIVSVSHTTRPMRPGETDGVDYHFVDKQAFTELERAGGFLESARVFDNFYGTTRSVVAKNLDNGIDVILEIDWQGAQQVVSVLPQAQRVFILPPSKGALEQRLRARGQDDEEVIQRRMRDAIREIEHYKEFDYVVVNDDFNQALSELRAIIVANRQRLIRQQYNAKALLLELLN